MVIGKSMLRWSLYSYLLDLAPTWLAICLCYYSIVDGGWGGWVTGQCSKTCGGGVRNFTRKCNNPEPFCNGKQCIGKSYYVFPGKCSDFCCPGKNMNIVACIQ